MRANFVDHILEHPPEKTALVLPAAWDETGVTESVQVTFGELAGRIGGVQAALREAGFRPGDRIVVMFPVGVDLYSLVLGLMASGMAAVLIDTGMGVKKVLAAMRHSGAKGIVSVHALLKHRWWIPTLWWMRKYCVDASGPFLRPAARLLSQPASTPVTLEREPDDHALITFTSGSTGKPKGADRTHRLLTEQHRALKHHFPEAADEIDMPCFPVVTLHNLCCGIPTVLPPVDFRAVAQAPAAAVWSFAAKHGVTRMSGAPAYVDRLVAHLEGDGERGSPDDGAPATLRQIGVGGARVPRSLMARVKQALPEVEAKVLYGSTEAEPIASVHFDEVLASPGDGVLVGTEAAAATVALLEVPDPPPTLDQRGVAPFEVADGEPGELVVSGPHVNRGYLDDPAATAENKLFEPDGRCWHRTGDVARRDEQGRLWLIGRTKDMVPVGDRLVAPYPVEEAVDALPGVARSAFLDVGGPVLVVQMEPGAVPPDPVALAGLVDVRGAGVLRVEVVDEIPVDPRHNSKIDRVRLRAST